MIFLSLKEPWKRRAFTRLIPVMEESRNSELFIRDATQLYRVRSKTTHFEK